MAVLVTMAWAKEPPIIGKLGRIVGTELTIECKRSPPWKGDYLLVTMVDGNELKKPVLLAVVNLAQPFNVATNVVCRFKGVETTYVVTPVIDPKTGEEMQQAAGGRHFEFKVTEVLAPEGVKIMKEDGPNHTSDGIRQPADGSPKPSR